jgi:hypothetical protein
MNTTIQQEHLQNPEPVHAVNALARIVLAQIAPMAIVMTAAAPIAQAVAVRSKTTSVFYKPFPP